jgi:cytochrome c556
MKTIIAAGAALACAIAAVAVAQPAPPTPEQQAARSVDLRKSSMKLIGFSFGPMRGFMQGNAAFDAAAFQTGAERLAVLGGMVPALFASDTSAFEVETTALDSIWTSKADFDMKAAGLVAAAEAVGAAAASGDEAAARDAVMGLGQACAACHDDFRSE